MKKLLLIGTGCVMGVLRILFPGTTQAQQTFEMRLPHPGFSQNGESVVMDGLELMDESMLFCGYHIDPSLHQESFILKIYSSGDTLCRPLFSNDSNLCYSRILSTDGHSCVVAGMKCVKDSGNLYQQVVLQFLDDQLQPGLRFHRQIPDQYSGVYVSGFQVNQSGNFLITGLAVGKSWANVSKDDIFIMEISPLGELVNERFFNQSLRSDFPQSLLEIPGTHQYLYFTGGYSYASMVQVLKLDSMFRILDIYDLDPRIGQVRNSAWTQDGRIVISYTHYVVPCALPDSRIELGYLNAGFNLDWGGYIDEPDREDVPADSRSLTLLDNGNILVGGTINTLIPGMPSWFCLASSNGNLNFTWTRRYGGNGNYRMHVLVPASDGGIVMAGSVEETGGTGYPEAYILKVDQHGYCTSVNEHEDILNVTIDENPGNGNIHLRCSGNEMKIAEVINVEGRLITRSAGFVSGVDLDLTGCSQGVYAVKIIPEKGLPKVIKYIRN